MANFMTNPLIVLSGTHAHTLFELRKLRRVADTETDLRDGHRGNCRGAAQGLLRQVGADQAVEHPRQQRVARAHRTGDADFRWCGVQRRTDAEPVSTPSGAVGNHHMLDTLSVQTIRRCGLRGDRYHLATQHFSQLFCVRLDQPWTGLEPGPQGVAAGVERDLQTEFFQAQDQRLQPLWTHALRQAAGDDDGVMPRSDPVKTIKQGLLCRCADLRPRAIDVGDATIGFPPV